MITLFSSTNANASVVMEDENIYIVKYESTFTNASDKTLNTISSDVYVPHLLTDAPYVKIIDSKSYASDNAIVTKVVDGEKGYKVYSLSAKNLESKKSYSLITEITLSTGSFHYNKLKSNKVFLTKELTVQYLSPEEKVESDNPSIIAESKIITNGITKDYDKAQKIFEYVIKEVTYNGAKGHNGALITLQTKEGVCEDYATLFVAICRASGIPARNVIGVMLNMSNTEYNVVKEDYALHQWAEVFVNGEWVYADPTMESLESFAKNNISDHFVLSYNNTFKHSSPICDTGFSYYFQGKIFITKIKKASDSTAQVASLEKTTPPVVTQLNAVPQLVKSNESIIRKSVNDAKTYLKKSGITRFVFTRKKDLEPNSISFSTSESGVTLISYNSKILPEHLDFIIGEYKKQHKKL